MKIATGFQSALAVLVLMTATTSNAQENQPVAQAEKPDKPPMPILRLDANGPVSQITSLLFSPDAKTLYAAGYDKCVYVWTRNAQGQYRLAPEKTLRIPIGPGVNDGLIKTLAISSDGKYLAAAGVAMGAHIAGFSEGGLMWPASTQSVAQRQETGTIYVFDLESKEKTKIIHLRDHAGPVTMLAFAPQPKQKGQAHVLVSAADEYDNEKGEQRGGLRVWHIEKPNKPIASYPDPGVDYPELTAPSKKNTIPRAIAALRAGNQPNAIHVGIAWGEDVLLIWDVSKKQVVDFPNEQTYAVANLKDNILLATGLRSGDDGIFGWHLSKWRPPVNARAKPTATARPMPNDNGPVGLAIAANADVALVISNERRMENGELKGDIGFFLLDTRNLQRLPNAANPPVKFSDSDHRYAYAIAADGSHIAVAGNLDRKIQVYKVKNDKTLEALKPLEGQGDLFPRVRFFAKGNSLGLGLNQAARTPQNNNAPPDLIFDLTESKTTPPAGWAEASSRDTANFTVQPIEDGRHQLVATLADGSTATITLPKNQFVRQFARCPETPNHPPLIATIIYSPDFAETILRVYSAKTGERLRQFSGHTDEITSIAFSQDGKLLASAGMDRTVRVWWMEDLKDHIGQVGFLDFLQLTDKQDIATVKAIDEIAAKRDIQDNLKVDDVIAGFTGSDGKFVETKKSKDFFYYLAATTPKQTVAVRALRNGRNVIPEPKIKVQQAVDERKPLFTLFFEKDQAQKWSWIGWTPTGPFDSSDREIEKLVGWHFNPAKTADDPNAPSTFAEIGEYRDDHHTENLLNSLAKTGAPPVPPPMYEDDLFHEEDQKDPGMKDPGMKDPGMKDPGMKDPGEQRDPKPVVLPPPDPVFSLFVKERHANPDDGYFPLELDDRQQVWAKTPKLKAVFMVTDFSTVGIDDRFVWELDGKRLNVDVAEPEPGVFEADLSGFNWQEKENDKPYLLRVSFKDRPDFFEEQAIVFDPEPVPEPVVTPMKVLPEVAIAEPDALTVLYDQSDKKEIAVTVRLRKAAAEAEVQTGRLTFVRNGAPLLQNGQPVSRSFDENTKEIPVTLPVENGANRIHALLTASDGEATRQSNQIVVSYRRPPRVKELNVTTDKLKPRGTVTATIQTPIDLPLTEVLLLVNNKMFILPDDLIPKGINKGDETFWPVKVENVLLVEGNNTIRIIPRNADGKVLSALKAEARWSAPDPDPPPSPKVLYVNVNDQVPLAGYWQGDPYTVEFNVLAPAKLERVLVYYNGKRLKEPKIPEPVNGMKYHFEVPVILSRSRNHLRVIAQDANGLWSERQVALSTLKPPVKVVIDQLLVRDGKPTVLDAISHEDARKPVEFGKAAAASRVVLRGRVITSDSTKKFKRPYVKCWVNGYMQTGQAFQIPNKPTEWEFAMNLVLNRPTNRLCLEMPEAPEIRASQKECVVNCTAPEAKQKLHLVLVGHGLGDAEMIKLEEKAKKSFGIKNGKTPGGNVAFIHRVPFGLVRNAQITRLLQWIQFSNPKKDEGEHQLVVFYYQGQEADKDDQIVLSTRDTFEGKSAFTAEILRKRLEEINGAHVVMLDVAQPQPVENQWDMGKFLGILRSVHGGPMPSGFPLASALEDPLEQTRKLKELPGKVRESFKQKGFEPVIEENPSNEIQELVLP